MSDEKKTKLTADHFCQAEQNPPKGVSQLDENCGHLNPVPAMLEVEASARYHLAAIIESAEDAIISKNLDGIVLSWNPGAERIFGYSAAEMVGQPILLLVPKDNQNEELNILSRLRSGEHIRNFITTRLRKDGTLVPVSLSVSPVLNSKGQIIGASKIARDITVERQLQAAQQELIEKLQQALAEVKALRGLIPICMHCKKIRDDKGFWEKLEMYFHKHGDFDFTHSICPDCFTQYYPELDELMRAENNEGNHGT